MAGPWLMVVLALLGASPGAWSIRAKDDPYQTETVRSATLPLSTYCYARNSEVKVAAYTERATGKVQGELVVRLNGVRLAGRITEASVLNLGPLRSVQRDAGNIRCRGSVACRMEYVEAFSLQKEHYESAKNSGSLKLRVLTTDAEACDFSVEVPAAIFSEIGLAP